MSSFSPTRLYTAADSRSVDRYAIEHCGLPGMVLMGRAARAAFALLRRKCGDAQQIQILCGPGNNGGDGLLVARLAVEQGLSAQVYLVAGEPRSADAQRAMTLAASAGVSIEAYRDGCLSNEGVIVDALLGTGISGPLREPYAQVIQAVNARGQPILSLDLPSGVNSDSGSVSTAAVEANWTISFITAKRGLYTGEGAHFAGAISCDDLGVPAKAYEQIRGASRLLRFDDVAGSLPERRLTAHKGRFGRCLLVGGDHGMGGAIVLAAEAALRSGAGLLKVATRAAHISPLLARLPESMPAAVSHRNHLIPLLTDASAIVVGPGLGQEPWGEQLLHACLASGKPLLVDADALNLLALQGLTSLPVGSVITPHPGEAARLLGVTTADVQTDRFAAAAELAERFDAAVVLKGNGSLIGDGKHIDVCAAGNPGMASGGMGDVLSGIIGSLLAQGCEAPDAARLGVTLHAQAGDLAAAERGEAGLLASDLVGKLGTWLK